MVMCLDCVQFIWHLYRLLIRIDNALAYAYTIPNGAKPEELGIQVRMVRQDAKQLV